MSKVAIMEWGPGRACGQVRPRRTWASPGPRPRRVCAAPAPGLRAEGPRLGLVWASSGLRAVPARHTCHTDHCGHARATRMAAISVDPAGPGRPAAGVRYPNAGQMVPRGVPAWLVHDHGDLDAHATQNPPRSWNRASVGLRGRGRVRPPVAKRRPGHHTHSTGHYGHPRHHASYRIKSDPAGPARPDRGASSGGLP
jgi:hypothetical protein